MSQSDELKLELDNKERLKELIVDHDALNEKINDKAFEYVQTLPDYKTIIELREEIADIVAGSIKDGDLRNTIINHVSNVLKDSDKKFKTSDELAKDFLNG